MLSDLWATDIWFSKVFAHIDIGITWRFPNSLSMGAWFTYVRVMDTGLDSRIEHAWKNKTWPAAPPKFHRQNHLWHNSGQACSPTASSNLWCLGDAAKSLYLSLWHGEIFSPDPPIYNHLQSIFDTLWIFSDLFWRKPIVWAIFQLSDVSYQHLVQLLVATIADFGGAQRPSMQRRGNGSSLTRETWTKLLDMMFS